MDNRSWINWLYSVKKFCALKGENSLLKKNSFRFNKTVKLLHIKRGVDECMKQHITIESRIAWSCGHSEIERIMYNCIFTQFKQFLYVIQIVTFYNITLVHLRSKQMNILNYFFANKAAKNILAQLRTS